jgi:hypothetical protein
MMMHNENGSHISNIEPSLGDAASRTIASINYIKSTVDESADLGIVPDGGLPTRTCRVAEMKQTQSKRVSQVPLRE